jgi:hypothetical protein
MAVLDICQSRTEKKKKNTKRKAQAQANLLQSKLNHHQNAEYCTEDKATKEVHIPDTCKEANLDFVMYSRYGGGSLSTSLVHGTSMGSRPPEKSVHRRFFPK